MPTTIVLTLIGALVLITTGVGFYFGTGMASVTALIPAFLGAPLLLCGLIAKSPGKIKLAMHVAAAVVLLGALGSSRVFMKWSDLSVPARSAQLITLAVCVWLLVTYIHSFIKARQARRPE